MLIAPPAVPRPSIVAAGPLRISICSVKKFSRTLTAGIANAVDEHVVARVKTTDEKAVAEGIPAFAGADE